MLAVSSWCLLNDSPIKTTIICIWNVQTLSKLFLCKNSPYSTFHHIILTSSVPYFGHNIQKHSSFHPSKVQIELSEESFSYVALNTIPYLANEAKPSHSSILEHGQPVYTPFHTWQATLLKLRKCCSRRSLNPVFDMQCFARNSYFMCQNFNLWM